MPPISKAEGIKEKNHAGNSLRRTVILVVFLITCLLGGWAAWMTGRACAQTWRTYPQLLLYLIPLGVAVRFIHFALFEGTLLSLHYYLVDVIVLMIIGTVGFRYTRTKQMVRQYNWLYEKPRPSAGRQNNLKLRRYAAELLKDHAEKQVQRRYCWLISKIIRRCKTSFRGNYNREFK